MNIIISGKVIHGEHLGKKLGFPTANLDRREYARKKMKIKLGVWAGVAKFKIKNLKLKIYRAGIVIGPLDKHHLPKIEAHLIGFKGNLYGRRLTISLIKFIRPFKKFKSEKDLKTQINKDIKKIEMIKYPHPSLPQWGRD